jgi:hypothetical protein
VRISSKGATLEPSLSLSPSLPTYVHLIVASTTFRSLSQIVCFSSSNTMLANNVVYVVLGLCASWASAPVNAAPVADLGIFLLLVFFG